MIFTKMPSGREEPPRMWMTPSLVKPRCMVGAVVVAGAGGGAGLLGWLGAGRRGRLWTGAVGLADGRFMPRSMA